MTASTEKALSAKDICAIIKECKDSGINELNYGSLHLNFAKKEEPEQNVSTYINKPTISKEEELERLKDEALLADPELYEELVEVEEATNEK